MLAGRFNFESNCLADNPIVRPLFTVTLQRNDFFSLLSYLSFFEELYQYRSQGFRSDLMRLTFQSTVLCIGDGFGKG